MRVVLEVTSGPREGHKVLVRSGQTVQVGRSWLTDLSFEYDQQMSSQHFTIHAEACVCYLLDESTTGTFVNDQPVKSATLQPNDRIRAGETEFIARIEGADAGVALVDPHAIASSADASNGRFDSGQSPSGLMYCRGSVADVSPEVLAERLSERYGELLVVDVTKLDTSTREQWTGSECLFDWLPEGARASVSPLLLSDGGATNRPAAIDALWGTDALVFVYGPKQGPVPLQQVRRYAGAFARPSLLRPHLSEGAPGFIEDLMRGIEAVLVEAEATDSWLLFSASAMHDALTHLGIRESTSVI